MLRTDRNALICDLAETYHIYDYKSLPCSVVAIFAIGLRKDSRIKIKMAGMECSLETMLMAGIYDKVSWLMWSQTEDAKRGFNKPESVLEQLMKGNAAEEYDVFDSPEEFDMAWQRAIGGEAYE